METEPILCFQHCEKGTNITCLELPVKCPICSKAIDSTPMEIPPFRLPSPLTDCRDKPFTVLVKPTQGSFLMDYKTSMDLHVGITDSKGYVYDYDEAGVHRNINGWAQSVAVPIVKNTRDPAFTYMWDAKLHEFTLQADWAPEKYRKEVHNCYDFVLGFLHHMGLQNEHPSISDRSHFCQQMVLPATSQAAKYIALYRKLLKQGVSVQPARMRNSSTSAATL